MTYAYFKTFLVVSVLLFASPSYGDSPGFRGTGDRPRADNSSLMAALEKSRYRLTAATPTVKDSDAKYSAVNYAGSLHARFNNHGIHLEPRHQEKIHWQWMLSLSSYGYGNRLQSIETADVSVLENRIEYRHRTLGTTGSEIREWYVNRAPGIEHGFTIPSPPEMRGKGDEPLHLALTVAGDLQARPAEKGAAIEFVSQTNATALRYSQLHAFDATGRELPSRMAVQEKRISLLVDDRSAVYPIIIDPMIYSETKLTSHSGDAGDAFGFAVATDGDTVAIGAPEDENTGENNGSVYIYVRSGANWVEQAHLTGDPFSHSFGASVAIDGDTLAVGDPTGGGNGMAFVYVRNGNSWMLQAYFSYPYLPDVLYSRLGTSVDVDGDSLVVGAPFESFQPLPNQPNTFGGVWVYVRKGNVWHSQAHLHRWGSDGADYDAFGTSVAISGNTIVVGSPSHDSPSGAGSVYVYVRANGDWVEQSHLFASDAAFGDAFGTSVDISGSTIVVGAPFDNTGAGSNVGSAYVYVRNVNIWEEQSRLFAGDGEQNDRFGSSVAVAGGNIVVVGAPFDNMAKGANAGSAYVYTRRNSSWSEQAKLMASDAAGEDQFGGSVAVALTKSGNRIIVGASGDNTTGGVDAGSAYEFLHSNPPLALNQAIEGVESLFNAGTLNYGEAHVLITQLNAVVESLDRGILDVAKSRLQEFVEQVISNTDARILSPAQAQILIEDVNSAIRPIAENSGALQ